MTKRRKLAILKENRSTRLVSITPANVSRLKDKFEIFIEKQAGEASGYCDEVYLEAGAAVIPERDMLIGSADLVVSIGGISIPEEFGAKKVFIGYYNATHNHSVMTPYLGKEADVYSLDLIPRTSLAQSMDILSSIAAISGYQAVITAAEMSPVVLPMITSAGGTLKPATFLVIGAGVAGLQAIATAKRLGANVWAFDVRKAAKQEVESLGGKFIEVEGAAESELAGGYAVEQSDHYLDEVIAKMEKIASGADVIITTAKIPGKRAPVLIDKRTVGQMKAGAVIIDLAAETGGNCAYTRKNEITEVNGVKIVGLTALWEKSYASLSYLVANNITSFLNHFHQNIEREEEDEILRSTKLIENGKVILPQIIQTINSL